MIDRQLLIHAYGDTPAVVATALRSARNAAAELGSDVSVHVVVQGPAVRELADQSDLSGELEESILDPRVVVLACRNSLRTAGLESTDLLPGVQTVPSAVAYLAERQWNGSAYVRDDRAGRRGDQSPAFLERRPMTVLTSIPSPPSAWSQFHLGPLTIHTYALCILTGIIAAVIITQRRLSSRGAGSGVVLDIIIWAVPIGIVGARFYHVFTHVGDYFFPGANLWNVFAIWDGGNALYGSLLGGAVGAYIGCRRHGIRFWSFADALAPAMLVAQSLGRFGNYFNHELFGLPTTLPWGLQIESTNAKFPPGLAAGTLFHPLFLYEIIWNLIGVAIILLVERKLTLRWGRAFAVYLIWYGLGRSWLEAIRIDPTSDGFLGIPANVWASFVAIALGITLFVVQTRRHPEPEPSVFRDGWVPRAQRAESTPETLHMSAAEEPVEPTPRR